MRLVKPSVVLIDEPDLYRQIEMAGRTCWKSEERMTDESAVPFVLMIIKKQHEAMLEHTNVILEVTPSVYSEIQMIEERSFIRLNFPMVSGNARAFREIHQANPDDSAIASIMHVLNKKYPILFPLADDSELDLDSVKLIDDETMCRQHKSLRMTHRSMTMKFICDRGVTHEFVRHRLFAFAQESTRYCNYHDGVSFIIPPWLSNDLVEGDGGKYKLNSELGEMIENEVDAWHYAMQYAEHRYIMLIENGWLPQEARSVLPNSLKTELVVTGNLAEWCHFFKLRRASTAHPQMREVANLAFEIAKTVDPIFRD